MQADWSLILNVLLLIGVVVAIGRLMKVRRQNLNYERYKPAPAKADPHLYEKNLPDDIIAVRKLEPETILSAVPAPQISVQKIAAKTSAPQLLPQDELVITANTAQPKKIINKAPLMMFLSAKEDRQFVGYELLQTVLASGLRFGEGQLFHRHEHPNGEGAIVCSLALATASGVFDLQNIGGVEVRGLCLFMHGSNDVVLNEQRFALMLATANQLRDNLDAYLLDEERKPLNAQRIAHYQRILGITEDESQLASA